MKIFEMVKILLKCYLLIIKVIWLYPKTYFTKSSNLYLIEEELYKYDCRFQILKKQFYHISKSKK